MANTEFLYNLWYVAAPAEQIAKGKTLPVSLTKGPVWIRIGDPPNLDVRLGGKLVNGLPSQAGNVLLTRSGLRPA